MVRDGRPVDDDFGGPCIPPSLSNAMMEITGSPLVDFSSSSPMTRQEVKIHAKRSALQWLAYQCLHLAYAVPGAEGEGLHCHLEMFGQCLPPKWDVTVTLELVDNEQIRGIRRDDGRCPSCGRNAASREGGDRVECVEAESKGSRE